MLNLKIEHKNIEIYLNCLSSDSGPPEWGAGEHQPLALPDGGKSDLLSKTIELI